MSRAKFKRWTPEEDTALLAMRARGCSFSAIDREIHRKGSGNRYALLTQPDYREKQRQKQRDRIERDPEKHRKARAAVYQRHKARLRETQAAYRRERREARAADRAADKATLVGRAREMLYAARHRSKKRNRDVTITVEAICAMWEKQGGKCFYTGRGMTCEIGKQETVSLDRVDSSRGYTPDNVVLCCTFFNSMKQDATPDELAAWCRSYLKHFSTDLC